MLGNKKCNHQEPKEAIIGMKQHEFPQRLGWAHNCICRQSYLLSLVQDQVLAVRLCCPDMMAFTYELPLTPGNAGTPWEL